MKDFKILTVGLALCLALVANGLVIAQDKGKIPPRPDAKLIAAWEKAGAEFGWQSHLQGVSAVQKWRSGKEEPKAGDLPAFKFQFEKFPNTKINELPAPDFDFGLWLRVCTTTGEGLDNLASFKTLRRLNLGNTKLNDEGMKKVAKLTAVRGLALDANPFTDIGLNELTALKDLEFLDLTFCEKVSRKASDELRKALPKTKIQR